MKLDAGVQTLERALMGEYQAVDWQKLQTEDPLAFNSHYVGYQQRYAVMQDIANQLAQEKQKYAEEQQAESQSVLRRELQAPAGEGSRME
jgi:hypothetical protein